ncbi:hypothetical protein B9J78_04355 [bacterium Unc6]|nr:hypothetical protein [bacterium Unc6]
MEYVTVEPLIDKAENSIYKLVLLVSRRAIEISNSASAHSNQPTSKKATMQALEDVRTGVVRIVDKSAKKRKADK